MSPRRASKDGNHAEIVKAFRDTGCSVVETHLPPVAGFPDLIVGCIGVTHLVECKNIETKYGRAGFSRSQSAFVRDWKGSPVELIESPDEAIDAVIQWRKPK